MFRRIFALLLAAVVLDGGALPITSVAHGAGSTLVASKGHHKGHKHGKKHGKHRHGHKGHKKSTGSA
jgi:hypothetical protein